MDTAFFYKIIFGIFMQDIDSVMHIFYIISCKQERKK